MKKKIIKLFLGIILLFLIGYTCIIIFYPTPILSTPYLVTIKDKNENIIYTLNRDEPSKYVKLDDISESIINTLIAIEDKNFYSHNGLDYKRIVKSITTNISNNKIIEGASTITQQLARQIYLSNEKTFYRKFNEVMIAKKLEASYSKNQIIELYLNSIYFGHNLYGIYSASKYYFNKLPIDIEYNEAAVLVGIINSPNENAPDINLSKCLVKKNQIIDKIYQNKIINYDEYIYYKSKNLNFYNKNDNSINYLRYYHDAIIKEAKSKKIYTDYNQRNGLSFSTSINSKVQELITNSISKYSKELSNQEIAIVVMKPYSGEVLGLVGGTNYTESQFNRAIDAKRQIGSTIKPLIYYLALDNGFTPDTMLESKETTFYIDGIGEYSPKNSLEKYANRKISMLEALSVSDNIYATKTTLILGSKSIENLLNKYNIKVSNTNPTIGLGTVELSPLELTSIYNSFASEGIYYKPEFIKSGKLLNNTTIYSSKESYKQILNKNNTLILNYMLRSPFDEAFQSYTSPSLINYQTKARFSAKTGTTESSSWVIGYNPKYTIGVYVGTDNNESLSNTKVAKSIFVDIANSLCPNEEEVFYSIPGNCRKYTLLNKVTNKVSFTYIKKSN